MIQTIDLKDKKLAQELFELQKLAYLIEAKLIDFYEIPPLQETFLEFLTCEESFLGYFEEDELVGALSYTIEGKELTICRMVVHPNHFRKGIAQKLLEAVEKLHNEINVFTLSTGRDNFPAKELYLKNGYSLVGETEVAPSFFISNFEKRIIYFNGLTLG
nr:GNAT family N-acetyltransferase [Neobacillus sp. Marseille-Q6967]